MKPIPLTTFDGYLKQMNSSSWDTAPQNLFNHLFPVFSDEFESTPSPATSPREQYERTLTEGLLKVFSSMLEVRHESKQPRRFSGVDFPRRRYFSVCMDEHGDDQNTLVHELRAYRDPVRSGMVEVIDLGIMPELTLMVGKDTYKLTRQREIAVLVHHPESIPEALQGLAVEKFRKEGNQSVWMFRFPYEIQPAKIPDVVDLRLPATRESFYEYFSKPQEDDGAIIWPEQMTKPADQPTVALSRYRLRNGRAPIPKDFYHMLPTLMNPDLGGGLPAWTGATVQAIGTWMRSHDVAALIYPSARCDVFVEIEKKTLGRFGGWNLVDYRNIEFDQRVRMTYFDTSPWCWVRFPKGVAVGIVPPHSPQEGSFEIQGMVNYWAEDYLDSLLSLETATTELGLPDHLRQPPKINAYEAWKIGIYLVRWLHIVAAKETEADLRKAVHILKGLALRQNLMSIIGEIDEIMEDLSDKFDFMQALGACVSKFQRVAETFQRNGHPDCYETVTIAGNFELLMLGLSIGLRGRAVSQDALKIDGYRQFPLSDALKKGLSTYMKDVGKFLAGKRGRAAPYLRKGRNLEAEIAQYFRSQMY